MCMYKCVGMSCLRARARVCEYVRVCVYLWFLYGTVGERNELKFPSPSSPNLISSQLDCHFLTFLTHLLDVLPVVEAVCDVFQFLGLNVVLNESHQGGVEITDVKQSIPIEVCLWQDLDAFPGTEAVQSLRLFYCMKEDHS